MTDYGQFCPVAKAAEVFAERWTPLVLRELLCGSTRYSEIRRGIPLMSPSLLSKRLKELEASGIIVRKAGKNGPEYQPTEAGSELMPIVMQLGEWGQRWSRGRIRPADYDPTVLMWDMRRRIRLEAVPEGGVVIYFHFADAPAGKRDYWLVIGGGEVDVCMTDPGHEIDVHVSCPIRTMCEAWMGEIDIAEAVRSAAIKVEGRASHVRVFPSWFQLNLLADHGARLAKAGLLK